MCLPCFLSLDIQGVFHINFVQSIFLSSFSQSLHGIRVESRSVFFSLMLVFGGIPVGDTAASFWLYPATFLLFDAGSGQLLQN